MKMRYILLALAGVAIATGSLVSAQPSDTDSNRPPPPSRRGGPPSAEMEAYHKKVLAAYDADKNGVLDETERAQLDADIAAGKFEAPPRQGHRMGPPPELLAQYDTNKDGVLDETERAALEADIQSGKLQLPPPPEGQGQGPDGPPPPPPGEGGAGDAAE